METQCCRISRVEHARHRKVQTTPLLAEARSAAAEEPTRTRSHFVLFFYVSASFLPQFSTSSCFVLCPGGGRVLSLFGGAGFICTKKKGLAAGRAIGFAVPEGIPARSRGCRNPADLPGVQNRKRFRNSDFGMHSPLRHRLLSGRMIHRAASRSTLLLGCSFAENVSLKDIRPPASRDPALRAPVHCRTQAAFGP